MPRTSQLKTAPNDRRRKLERLVVVATVAVVWMAAPPIRAGAEDDVLQKAINYVFTGTVDPKDAPEVVDRKSCVVVMRDPRLNRFIRYYLTRLHLDDPNIDSTYAGRQVRYQLDVESGNIVVEYLAPDKTTVINGYKSAQIPLPGDIDQTKKALQLIAARCKQDGTPKLPF
jgi:hypothetical protein